MGFIYPRTVTLTRPQPRPGASTALPGYGGSSPDDEALNAQSMPASIQFSTTARGTGSQLPSDARAMVDFKILLPRKYSPLNMITERDILTDELGKRYQVYAAYWSPMGYDLRATLLEV